MDHRLGEGPDEILAVRGLGKTYGDGHVALRDVDATLARGRALVVVGGSGSGKSTLLRCLAGLEMPDDGVVEIDGRTVVDRGRGIHVPPERRRVSMMFQDYALWPHMTVRGNVTYPIRRQADRAAVRATVERTLDMVGCLPLAEKRPAELSGGEQQRVALARSLVGVPSVLLADEPFSNLDTVLRDRIRGDFLAMRQTVGFSLVHVTHDPREAMMLADTLLVLYRSRTADVGPPLRVYRRPRSVIAAQALGVVNQFPGRIVEVGEAPDESDAVRVMLETDTGLLGGAGARTLAVGQRAVAVARPTHLRVLPSARAEHGMNRVPGRIRYSTVLGDVTEYSVTLGNGDELRVEAFQGAPLEVATAVQITVPVEDLWIVPEPPRAGSG